MESAPLSYHSRFKSKERIDGFTQINKSKHKQKRNRTEMQIVIVTDTLNEKNFRVAYFMTGDGEPTELAKVPCGLWSNSLLPKEIAKSLTVRDYYSGDLDSPLQGELYNAFMKFQADQSLSVSYTHLTLPTKA